MFQKSHDFLKTA